MSEGSYGGPPSYDPFRKDQPDDAANAANSDPFGQPGYGASQSGQPQSGQPQYGQPQYGQPGYGAPQYGQPGFGDPQYGQPQYGQPQYGAPQYGQPGYGAPQYGQPGYGPPPMGPAPYPGSPYGAYPQPGDSNGMAVAGFVLSILGFCCVGWILGLVFGFIGLSRSKQMYGKGRGLALAAIIISFVWIALDVVYVILAVAVNGN